MAGRSRACAARLRHVVGDGGRRPVGTIRDGRDATWRGSPRYGFAVSDTRELRCPSYGGDNPRWRQPTCRRWRHLGSLRVRRPPASARTAVMAVHTAAVSMVWAGRALDRLRRGEPNRAMLLAAAEELTIAPELYPGMPDEDRWPISPKSTTAHVAPKEPGWSRPPSWLLPARYRTPIPAPSRGHVFARGSGRSGGDRPRRDSSSNQVRLVSTDSSGGFVWGIALGIGLGIQLEHHPRRRAKAQAGGAGGGSTGIPDSLAQQAGLHDGLLGRSILVTARPWFRNSATPISLVSSLLSLEWRAL